MGIIIFNGVSSEELGLISQIIPSYEFPQSDFISNHIPGRNGDIIVNTGSYKNVNRSYSIVAVFKPNTNFIQNATAIVKWLTSAKGYARLEDSYEPDYYRLAIFTDQGSLQNIYNEATAIDVNFNCKPERYLKIGDVESVFDKYNNSEINPTNYTAKPELIFPYSANEEYVFKFTDSITDKEYGVKIKPMDISTTIYVDCVDMECYYIDENNKRISCNKNIELSDDFPTISPYAQLHVDIPENYYETIKIKPRWWIL